MNEQNAKKSAKNEACLLPGETVRRNLAVGEREIRRGANSRKCRGDESRREEKRRHRKRERETEKTVEASRCRTMRLYTNFIRVTARQGRASFGVASEAFAAQSLQGPSVVSGRGVAIPDSGKNDMGGGDKEHLL